MDRVDVVEVVGVDVRIERRREGGRPERAPADADVEEGLAVLERFDGPVNRVRVNAFGEVQRRVAVFVLAPTRFDAFVCRCHVVVEPFERVA